MKTIGIGVGLFFLLVFRSPAQERPFQVQWDRDLGTLLNGGMLALNAHLLQLYLSPLSAAQLAQLDPVNVSRFDRIATRAYRPTTARLSDVLLSGSLLLPFALSLHPRLRDDFGELSFLALQTFVYSDALTNWTKYGVKRTRPLAYLPASQDLKLLALQQAPDARLSFFSGHTSGTACATFFAAQVFDAYWPDHPARPYVWIGAATLPAVVGLLRVRAGKHFPSDVIAGYVVGASVGLVNPWLHRRNRR